MEKPQPINKEYFLDGKKIITETDTRGFVTYGNKNFYEASGYTQAEFTKQTHDIIRHPDMPSAIFEKMWRDINQGKEWRGFIKNLRKDGSFYWVESHIIPTKDQENNCTGYIAAQYPPNTQDLDSVKQQYKTMRQEEDAQRG